MRILRFEELGVSATEQAWQALGAEPHSNSDEIRWQNFRVGDRQQELRELFLLAYHEVGQPEFDNAGIQRNGARLIAWVCAERQRRSEERTRVTAQAKESQALLELAAAIKGASAERALESLLGKLSERTRQAVRLQVGV